jgi:hypothetical protein
MITFEAVTLVLSSPLFFSGVHIVIEAVTLVLSSPYFLVVFILLLKPSITI